MKLKRLFFFLLPALFLSTSLLFGESKVAGAVYTMNNSAGGNSVLVFDRNADGSIQPAGSFSTGGLGTGTGLGNQGAVVLSEDERWLLVVNPGSDEISAFRVSRAGLELRDTVPSGGQRPISITIHDKLIYVLNAGGGTGGTDNISGFIIGTDGNLTAIPGSTKPLSGASTGPAQIEFSPDGQLLVVTEKATNIIDTYVVGPDGLPGNPDSQASEGQTPFGFAFGKRNQLFVSEAFGGAADASAVSSYAYQANGDLQTISPSVATNETAACWVVVTNDGRFAYVTNTGSATISGYEIGFDGTISLLDSDGITATTGAAPIDMALSNNSRFLYTLDSGAGNISGFRINSDGSLVSIGGIAGLPAGTNGLAAR
ncbi:lactonase family protein [bacterium]|nr:lactonase family protein [bacterium]MCI0605453.1 lactonase family protein [bacterium]